MALVLLCGLPLSGKTLTSQKLVTYFKDKGQNTILISEEDFIKNNNDLYKDVKNEMELRQKIKSEINRCLNKNEILVVDSTNYIKSNMLFNLGYRYELYCIAKSLNTKYCVIYCGVSKENIIQLNNMNQKYETKIIEEIAMRFEEPSFKNRWDMPLYVVDPFKGHLNFEEIYNDLIFRNKKLIPNIATKNQKISQNFVHETDKITQNIIKDLMKAQQSGQIIYKLSNDAPNFVTLDQKKFDTVGLFKLRRQFINMVNNNFASKIDRGESEMLDNIGELFVTYIEEQNDA